MLTAQEGTRMKITTEDNNFYPSCSLAEAAAQRIKLDCFFARNVARPV
jgi:hypothetical protein